MKAKLNLLKITAVALAVLIIASCTSYNKITFTNADFYNKKNVAKNIENYDVILHNDNGTFLLENTSMEDGKLSGVLKEYTAPPAPVVVEDADSKKTKKAILPEEERNDIHVYLKETSTSKEKVAGDDVALLEKDVEEATIYAKKMNGLAGVGITLLIVFGVLLIGFIVLIYLAISSAAGSSPTSDSGSSDSGGSDSGGSDSGGSDSGCYIATMSYGSYDAPQVLVLRQFRDKFLQKYGWGRSFIKWYYKTSPGFVKKHESKKWLHKVIRVPLNMLVSVLRLIY